MKNLEVDKSRAKFINRTIIHSARFVKSMIMSGKSLQTIDKYYLLRYDECMELICNCGQEV